MEDLVRFGTHAPIIRANGYDSLIPSIGKTPAVLRYPEYALHPADRVEFASWLRLHPAANISLVVNGSIVVVDVDILDEDLVKEVVELATRILGPVDFRRIGQAPKVALFYRALDSVPTRVGPVIEIFSTPGSKQVLLFGRHPETGTEYDWPGLGSPLSHRFEQMPGVHARQVVAFHEAGLKAAADAGYAKPSKQKPGASFGPSHSVGGVGDMMAQILRALSGAGADPLAVASSYFEQAPDGAKHYAMVSAVSVLVLRGYSDQQIVDALIDVYRLRVGDDPGLKNLLVCPSRVRRGLLRRGAVLPDKPADNRLTDEQRAAYERARGMVRGIFYSRLPRAAIEERAASLIERIDPSLRRKIGTVVAFHLARCGWPEGTIADALSLAARRPVVGIPDWLKKAQAR